MKRSLWIALVLLASCAPLVGCATPNAAPNEQAAETVYVDIEQDSTESLRANLQNNKALDAVNGLE